MDTRQILAVEDEIDTAKAIAQLEQANKTLLTCATFDATGIEAALAERDQAVRVIAAADVTLLEEPLAERLRVAFEDGRRIRQKLVALYRGCDTELKRLERMHAGDPNGSEPPKINAVG